MRSGLLICLALLPLVALGCAVWMYNRDNR